LQSLVFAFAHGKPKRLPLCALQVSDLLSRMTPDAARLDLQTSAFTELLEKRQLAALPGAVRSTEPWYWSLIPCSEGLPCACASFQALAAG
jgi:hypothetical protein